MAFLEKERPQTKALILAQLGPRHASSILAALPDETRIDVVKRMAQLGYCSPEVNRDPQQVLKPKTATRRRRGNEGGGQTSGERTGIDELSWLDQLSFHLGSY